MSKTIMMVGNGSYNNRGCEAIIRGTINIFSSLLTDVRYISACAINDKKSIINQNRKDENEKITHIQLKGLKDYLHLYHPSELLKNITMFINPSHQLYRDILIKQFSNLDEYVTSADMVLSVGGDNYSLDYGKPIFFTTLDDYILNLNKKYFIWGSSIGPFSKEKKFEKEILNHFRNIPGIFVRESYSYNYLINNNIIDVFKYYDPAFGMEAREPNLFPYDMTNSIGFNVSPLFGKYVNQTPNQWINSCIKICNNILNNTEFNIMLIPHVITGDLRGDDLLLKNISKKINNQRVQYVGDQYDASELKWIISRCNYFIGSRTHATIAAFSSCVPTLSLAYSVKARGINFDLFNDLKWCIEAKYKSLLNITNKIKELELEYDDVIRLLRNKNNEIKKSTQESGKKAIQLITRGD